MIGLLRGELLKVRTTRSFWWTLVASFALMLLFVIVPLAQGVGSDDDLRSVLSTPGVVGLFMIVIGIVGAAGEYRHGTITSSLLAVPHRTRFMLGKAAAFGLAGALAGIVAMAVTILATVIFLNGDGLSMAVLGVDGGVLAGIIAGNVAYAALSAALGVALGAILRNQIAGIVGVLILILLVDSIMSALVSGYGQYSLSGISSSMTGGTTDDAGFHILSGGAATLLYLGYTAILLTAAIVLDNRRDVAS